MNTHGVVVRHELSAHVAIASRKHEGMCVIGFEEIVVCEGAPVLHAPADGLVVVGGGCYVVAEDFCALRDMLQRRERERGRTCVLVGVSV